MIDTISDRRIAWMTLLVTSTVYIVTSSLDDVYNSDVQAAVIPAIAIAQTGTPWLEGFYSGENIFIGPAGDHVVSNRPIGISLLAVPAYLLAGAPALAWPSAVTAALATASAVTLMHLALRRLVPAGSALAATLVFAFATPTWTVSADSLWGHTVTQLAIAAAVFAASRQRWWWMGVALGVGIWGRPHIAVIALVVGLMLAWSQRSLRTLLAVGIPASAGLGLLVLANRWLYGRWTVSGYGSYVTDNLTSTDAWTLQETLANVAGFFVSPGRGLFVWTPIALILLPAAIKAVRSSPPWVVAFAAGGLAYSLVQLRINWFHGVDAFYGYRLALELVTCLVPLYAIAWQQTRSPLVRGLSAFVVVLQVAAMAVGAFRTSGFISVDEVWTDNSIAWLMRYGLSTSPIMYGTMIISIVAVALLVGRRASSDAPIRREVAAS